MENEEIVFLIQNGQTEYLEQLYLQNKRMIYKIIRKCGIKPENIEDALQDGYIGLHMAALGFNADLGLSFSTFAYKLIFHGILRGTHTGKAVYMPDNIYYKLYSIQRAKKQLLQATGKEPTAAEISELYGISVADIKTISEAAESVKSLNEPCNTSNGTAGEFGDLLSDDTISIEERGETTELKRLIALILKDLSTMERNIIIYRFIHEKTQIDTARLLHLPQDEVRRQEATALRKLRHYSNRILFEDYI